MSAREVFKDGRFHFTMDGSKEYKDGKVDWPSMLDLSIPRERVPELIATLAHALENKETTVTINFVGSIEEVED